MYVYIYICIYIPCGVLYIYMYRSRVSPQARIRNPNPKRRLRGGCCTFHLTHTYTLDDTLCLITYPYTVHCTGACSGASQPSTLNPQPSTLNPQPSTLNPASARSLFPLSRLSLSRFYTVLPIVCVSGE